MAGKGLTTTVADAVVEQPPALVTVTVYVVVTAGVTLILAVVFGAGTLHRYVYVVPEASPVTAKFVVEPAQIFNEPAVITGAGLGITVIVLEAVAVQPSAEVTVTV